MPHKQKPRAEVVEPTAGITAASSIAKLAAWSMLEELGHHELVAYIRLLAAVAKQQRNPVAVWNADLCSVPRTAVRALRKLEENALIRVSYPGGAHSARLIEVR